MPAFAAAQKICDGARFGRADEIIPRLRPSRFAQGRIERRPTEAEVRVSFAIATVRKRPQCRGLSRAARWPEFFPCVGSTRTFPVDGATVATTANPPRCCTESDLLLPKAFVRVSREDAPDRRRHSCLRSGCIRR